LDSRVLRSWSLGGRRRMETWAVRFRWEVEGEERRERDES
jgi:hypothetical protein